MKRAINFFHNENKILTSYDETFFKKTRDNWIEVNKKSVFKGLNDPENSLGNDGDYYIQYEEAGNYLLYSEDFSNIGWINTNNSLSKDFYIKFPETYSTKIIPSTEVGEHSISTSWTNPLITDMPSWCLSFYILPDEIKYFDLSLSNYDESFGVVAHYSITLNARRKYVIEKSIERFGEVPENEIEDETFDIEQNNDGTYRIYISAKFNTTSSIKGKLKLLRNINGEITDNFANINNTAGLFINAAQLNKGLKPMYYVPSDGKKFVYMVYKRLWIKEESWEALPLFNSMWYGSEYPDNSIGEKNDIYFIEPILTIDCPVRFGKNTLFKTWRSSWSNNGFSGNYYYTENLEPSVNDKVYTYDEKPEEVGYITSYTKSSTTSPSTITVKINGSLYTLYRNPLEDKRFLTDEGLLFWNKDNGTYSYMTNNEQRNLQFGVSFYDRNLFLDAISFSTNLFNQTYSSRRDCSLGQKQFGFNTGGNYNSWGFNNLRKHY